MKILYEPEDLARKVSGQLKVIAAKSNRSGNADPLHLPDFLDVAPVSSHEEWKKHLEKKRRDVKNAPEGTADEEEKLCQTLALLFSEKDKWRGLLNRLGRMEVESAIRGLARRRPGPDILRSAYETHVHTLTNVVGAPDGRKIVEQLFEERGLSVPEKIQPIANPDVVQPELPTVPAESEFEIHPFFGTEIVRPELPPVPGRPEVATAPASGSLLRRLGGMLIEVLGEQLDQKLNETRERAEEERRLVAQTPAVSGEWYAPGWLVNFSQRGSQLDVQATGPGVTLNGSGKMRGKSIQLHGMSLPFGPFSASLAVSPDGNMLTGQLTYGFGQVLAVQLRR